MSMIIASISMVNLNFLGVGTNSNAAESTAADHKCKMLIMFTILPYNLSHDSMPRAVVFICLCYDIYSCQGCKGWPCDGIG